MIFALEFNYYSGNSLLIQLYLSQCQGVCRLCTVSLLEVSQMYGQQAPYRKKLYWKYNLSMLHLLCFRPLKCNRSMLQVNYLKRVQMKYKNKEIEGYILCYTSVILHLYFLKFVEMKQLYFKCTSELEKEINNLRKLLQIYF